MSDPSFCLAYCTTSNFKKNELEIISSNFEIEVVGTNRKIGDIFTFDVRQHDIIEILACDLETMVRQKAFRAYELIKSPCIVEHAGLIFSDLLEKSFPGGLTQPMWDALGPQRFLEETASSSRPVIARAAVGFCDGKKIRTFTGDTVGTLSKNPRGNSQFYWDPIFCPNNENGAPSLLTYAEIVENPTLGLRAKVQLSQSRKAIQSCLQWVINDDDTCKLLRK